MINIGINGFGRIGKCIFLQLLNNKNFNICAINAINLDIFELEDYLNYDSNHKYPKMKIKIISNNEFIINNHKVFLLSDTNAKNLNWRKHNCKYIIDATGVFLTTSKCFEVLRSSNNSPTHTIGFMLLLKAKSIFCFTVSFVSP